MPGPLIADWIGIWPDATLVQSVFPFAPELSVPVATDGQIRVRVKKPDGSALDCSTGLFVLTVRKQPGVGDPVLSRVQTSADNLGNVYFDLSQADTIPYLVGDYVRSVEGTIAAVREQVVPVGRLSIGPSAANQGDVLTTLYPSPAPIIGLPPLVAQRYLYSPDGVTLQWATVGASSNKSGSVTFTGQSTATVTFGTPFPNANYGITLAPTKDASGAMPFVSWGNKTANGFTIYVGGLFNGSVDWSANAYAS